MSDEIDLDTSQVETNHRSQPVLVTHKDTKEMRIYPSIADAAKATGVSEFLIQKAINDPFHHTHRESCYETNYALRGSSVVNRQRRKYCEYDFQPYRKTILTCYDAENVLQPRSYASLLECCADLGVRKSTLYLRQKQTKPGVFSAPVKDGDGHPWLVVFNDKTETLRLSAPSYEEVMGKYNGMPVPETEEEAEFFSEPENVSALIAREAAKEVLPPSEVRAIMREYERTSKEEERHEQAVTTGGTDDEDDEDDW